MQKLIRAVAFAWTIGATIGAFAGGSGEASEPLLIDADRLSALISTSEVVVLDIRDTASYLQGHIPGSILVPLSEVERVGLEFVSFGRPIITYCSCPAEESSLSAAHTLQALGASRVYVLQGGYRAWQRAGNPVVTGRQP